MQKLIKTIENKIRDEELQYNINRERSYENIGNYHRAKLININVLQTKNYYSLINKNDRTS